LKQIAPSGGSFPRQFSINNKGDLVAVGLQMDGRVVVIQRNVDDGTLGDFVASVDVAGQVTSVIWDESVEKMVT
jgi:6-phosphogluconolactonase (cycloisomerase 2 family)